MNAGNIVMLTGWFFLILSWVWPLNKWGGRVVKVVFSALSTGLFIAEFIYTFVK